MAVLFVSHSSKDDPVATALEAWLRANGFTDVFVDHQSLAGGAKWREELRISAGACRVVVCLITENWLASNECFNEFRAAWYMGKRLVPLLLLPPFPNLGDEAAKRFAEVCAEFQGIDLTPCLGPGRVLDLEADAKRLSAPEHDYLAACRATERLARSQKRRVQVLIYALFIGIIAGLVGWINQSYIREQWRWYAVVQPFLQATVRPHVLTPAAEQSLKPKDSFRECAAENGRDYCPEVVVVPVGSFVMGSPPDETARNDNEGPQHHVTIARPFAVSKFELTFDEWDTCVDYGDCEPQVRDAGWGRGRQPMIYVSWNDAQRYVEWLSRMTGKPYRLLTEAEYQYATRAAMKTAYPWGDDVRANGAAMADCNGCGSRWDERQAAPVGSFVANSFGLFDMVGNVWQWVEDCVHQNYEGAPVDGSAWANGNCNRHVVAGGAWNTGPQTVRAASHNSSSAGYRGDDVGIRVGRTLAP